MNLLSSRVELWCLGNEELIINTMMYFSGENEESPNENEPPPINEPTPINEPPLKRARKGHAQPDSWVHQTNKKLREKGTLITFQNVLSIK